jgi:hypothetical protein
MLRLHAYYYSLMEWSIAPQVASGTARVRRLPRGERTPLYSSNCMLNVDRYMYLSTFTHRALTPRNLSDGDFVTICFP